MKPPEPGRPLRFVSAASLFDGHDAAINMIRRLLQSGGAEVVHLGHNRSVADIVRAAIAQARQASPSTSVCLIGDTPADIAAARANVIPVIAVATGIFGFDELLTQRPDLCLSCCTDLFQ